MRGSHTHLVHGHLAPAQLPPPLDHLPERELLQPLLLLLIMHLLLLLLLLMLQQLLQL